MNITLTIAITRFIFFAVTTRWFFAEPIVKYNAFITAGHDRQLT